MCERLSVGSQDATIVRLPVLFGLPRQVVVDRAPDDLRPARPGAARTTAAVAGGPKPLQGYERGLVNSDRNSPHMAILLA